MEIKFEISEHKYFALLCEIMLYGCLSSATLINIGSLIEQQLQNEVAENERTYQTTNSRRPS